MNEQKRDAIKALIAMTLTLTVSFACVDNLKSNSKNNTTEISYNTKFIDKDNLSAVHASVYESTDKVDNKNDSSDANNVDVTKEATAESQEISITDAKGDGKVYYDGSKTTQPKECKFKYNTDKTKGLVPTFNGYSVDDLYCLTVVIFQEAGGDKCSNDTRLKVGNVVLNRVESKKYYKYATSIRTAILGKDQYGELYYTGVKFADRAKNEPKAVFRAEQMAIRLLEGERVLPKNVVMQAQYKQGDGVYCYQDGEYFCYKD